MLLIDTIYKNHPNLDERYRKIFDLRKNISMGMLEVCDRNGSATIALWLVRNEYNLNEVAPLIMHLYSDVLTSNQVDVCNALISEHTNSDLIIVNPDKYKNILRYYYRHDGRVAGKDIEKDGSISKTKEYTQTPDDAIITVHSYADGHQKTTYADIDYEPVDIPACVMTIHRDDGFIYYYYEMK